MKQANFSQAALDAAILGATVTTCEAVTTAKQYKEVRKASFEKQQARDAEAEFEFKHIQACEIQSEINAGFYGRY